MNNYIYIYNIDWDMIGSSKAEGMVLGLEVEFRWDWFKGNFRWIGLRETLQEPPTNLMITTMFPCSFFSRKPIH